MAQPQWVCPPVAPPSPASLPHEVKAASSTLPGRFLRNGGGSRLQVTEGPVRPEARPRKRGTPTRGAPAKNIWKVRKVPPHEAPLSGSHVLLSCRNTAEPVSATQAPTTRWTGTSYMCSPPSVACCACAPNPVGVRHRRPHRSPSAMSNPHSRQTHTHTHNFCTKSRLVSACATVRTRKRAASRGYPSQVERAARGIHVPPSHEPTGVIATSARGGRRTAFDAHGRITFPGTRGCRRSLRSSEQ